MTPTKNSALPMSHAQGDATSGPDGRRPPPNNRAAQSASTVDQRCFNGESRQTSLVLTRNPTAADLPFRHARDPRDAGDRGAEQAPQGNYTCLPACLPPPRLQVRLNLPASASAQIHVTTA